MFWRHMEGHENEIVFTGPDVLYQGETGYFRADNYVSGALAAATSATIAIRCLTDNQVVVASSTAMSTSTTGIYTYSYACSATAVVGKYVAQAIITNTADVNMTGVKYFDVREAV